MPASHPPREKLNQLAMESLRFARSSQLLAMLLAMTNAVSAATANFEKARELYYRGVEGDKAATKQSTQLLEQLAAKSPGDPLIAAYLASNRLLESSRTFALWNKNRLAKEGVLGL